MVNDAFKGLCKLLAEAVEMSRDGKEDFAEWKNTEFVELRRRLKEFLELKGNKNSKGGILVLKSADTYNQWQEKFYKQGVPIPPESGEIISGLNLWVALIKFELEENEIEILEKVEDWKEFKTHYERIINTETSSPEQNQLYETEVKKEAENRLEAQPKKTWLRFVLVAIVLFSLVIISFSLLDIQNIFKRNLDRSAKPDNYEPDIRKPIDKYPIQEIIDKDQFIEMEYIDKDLRLHTISISVNSSWSDAYLLVNGYRLPWDESTFNIKKIALPEGRDLYLKLINNKDTCTLGSVLLFQNKSLNSNCN